ncbi:heavy-metal-associated domain-containing protein [Singulisphaera sp. PoT]|uniref:heavy-metal-associated domain-containing protein n=1 Tax=Singulisphaera sp. PoT TaxID=3411797 RepID=UPI003BF5DE72
MMRHLLCIALLIAARPGVAGDVTVKYRLMGLFQPDRAEDLRKQAGTLAIDEGGAKTLVKLVDIDFEAATATFSYDADAKAFQGKSPQQVHESINNHLRNASRHNFNAFPPDTSKPEKLVRERIAVAGLDCKGCAYGAYRAVATIDGVDRAVVSFKGGHVTAWIDPSKTKREALVAALKKAEVDVVEPETARGKSADAR